MRSLTYWAERSDREDRARHRTEFQVSDGLHPMSAGWARYHRDTPTVRVIDIDGRERWITPTQHSILLAVRSLSDQASMSRIAASLGYATSTVSRALVRLASMGLIAYDVSRGRYGGIRIVQATAKELRARAQAAWERLKAIGIRQRARAVERSYARLAASGYPMQWLNVASYTEKVRNIGMMVSAWTPITDADIVPEY